MPNEVTLDVDDFGNTLILQDNNAIGKILQNLIIQKKNYDPLNPDKGVDINSYRYRLGDNSTISDITKNVTDQISTYTPFVPTDVIVQVLKMHIVIVISLQGNKNAFFFQSDGVKTSFDIIQDS